MNGVLYLVKKTKCYLMKKVSIKKWLETVKEIEKNYLLDKVSDHLDDYLEDNKKQIIKTVNDGLLWRNKRWSDDWYELKDYFFGSFDKLWHIRPGDQTFSGEVVLTMVDRNKIKCPWKITQTRAKVLNQYTDVIWGYNDNTVIIYNRHDVITMSISPNEIISYFNGRLG